MALKIVKRKSSLAIDSFRKEKESLFLQQMHIKLKVS